MPPTSELESFTEQGREHLDALRELLGRSTPPDIGSVQRVTASTRALRGTASLIGLDPFQSFLGKMFGLLEEVQSSEVPWSTRLEMLLGDAQQAESAFLESIARGESPEACEALARIEAELNAWRREQARRYEGVTPDPAKPLPASVPASDDVEQTLLTLVESARQLQTVAASGSAGAALQTGLKSLAAELQALGEVLAAAPREVATRTEELEGGFWNHCDGALRSLAESAAQEVLDKAQDDNVRLALRATGAVDEIDDELGGLLLEVLRNLWLDSLAMQTATGTARIDCVIREDEDRMITEVHDPGPRLCGTQEHDVFSRYTGLRRSRPAVESLQGLVWVEPPASPGCRFRVALPRTTTMPSAQIVRIGAHEVALPTAAIVGMYSLADAHVVQDGAGAVVEIEGARHPILHLAFVLQDVSFDELEREMVVLVGSFERRAALFASGPCWSVTGRTIPGPDGPWSGNLDTVRGVVPMLDVGALLGRRRNSGVSHRIDSTESVWPQVASVLVVNSSEMERLMLVEMLDDASYRTSSVQSAEEAFEFLQERSVDLVLCDLRLPEMNAQRFAEFRSRSDRLAHVPILLVLSHASEQSPLVVKQLGASDFVCSPIQREELTNVVQRLLGESKP